MEQKSGLELGFQLWELEPTKEAGRVASVDAGHGNIFRNNCAGPYDDLVTYRDWENGGICSDANMITDFSWTPQFWLSGGTTVAKQVINEHRAMGNETVIPYRNQLTNERVRLNSAAFSDACSFLYLYERSDESFIADLATIEVGRLYDSHVRPEFDVNNPDCVKSNRIHTPQF
jgi:hypothetical protein